MFRLVAATLIISTASPPAGADTLPGPGQPPPPVGPAEATIRGVSVARLFTYFAGQGWIVEITSCQDSACGLVGCYVVGAGGKPIAGGDVATLLRADAKAGKAPMTLDLAPLSPDLDTCGLTSVTLPKPSANGS